MLNYLVKEKMISDALFGDVPICMHAFARVYTVRVHVTLASSVLQSVCSCK